MYLQKEKATRKTNKKKTSFVGILEVTDEKTRIWIRSVNQVNGTKDPDPYQNVTNPERCFMHV